MEDELKSPRSWRAGANKFKASWCLEQQLGFTLKESKHIPTTGIANTIPSTKFIPGV